MKTKLTELIVGDTVQTDDGFTCLQSGLQVVQEDEDGCLFIPCSEGKHFLEGQLDFNNPEFLVGIFKVSDATPSN